MLDSIAMEPLLYRLRQTLEGVSIPYCSTPFHLSAYADDIILLISRNSDMEINPSSIAWVLGGGYTQSPRRAAMRRDGFKYLGVFLGNDTVM